MKTRYCLFLLSWLDILLGTAPVYAQTAPSIRKPVADNTLSTQVSGADKDFTITGGLNRGQNLFHSFQDFSVPTGGSATFNNPVGNRSIITRVTGSNFSDIDGRIDTQGANFFLINPNGMVFGANARLNVGQTFVGSTANGIDFVDAGGNSYRFGTSGNDAPLLTINPNALLAPTRLIMGGGKGEITNFGTLKTDNQSQYIGLIGGNVNLNGSKIIASGGRVELGGLVAPGTVTFGAQGEAQLPTDVARGNVSLTNQAWVDVTGAGGGDIAINVRNLEMSGNSRLRSGVQSGFDTPITRVGDIKIDATETIALSDSSVIQNIVSTGAAGKAGNVEISARTLSVTNGSQLQALTRGQGEAGSVKITASENVSFDGGRGNFGSGASSTVEEGAKGKGGNVEINTRNLSVTNGAQLTASTRGQGEAGSVKIIATENVSFDGVKDGLRSGTRSTVEEGAQGKGGGIEINTRNLSVTNGAGLISNTLGQGDAGSVKITATENIFFDNSTVVSSAVARGAKGKGGNVEINTRNLSVTNGAQLFVSTFGEGDAGNVKITASENVFFDGVKDGLFSGSGSTVERGANGKGGSVEINTRNLSVTNGAQLSGSTRGQGDAGSVKITTTENVFFDGRKDGFSSAAFSNVERGANGKGGSVEINTRNLSMTNSAQLVASTSGKGDAGSIKITATENVSFDGVQDDFRSAALSVVEPGGEGRAGGIEINTRNLSVTNGAGLGASTLGKGNAGNVKIIASENVFFDSGKEGFDSAAFSTVSRGGEGKGGSVEINTRNLSVTDRAQLTTSTFGEGDAGSVKIFATENVFFDNSNAVSAVARGAKGKGGNVEVNTRNLFVTNDAQLGASTFGQGDAGSVKITATENIFFDGGRGNFRTGALSAVEQEARGKGGSVEINTRNLLVTNGAQLNASTRGRGDAGSVKITATENVSFDGRKDGFVSGARSTVQEGTTGKGGGVKISSRILSVSNGAVLSSSSGGQGDAGNIVLKSDRIILNGGEIDSVALASTGGDITITTKDFLLLRNNSIIATNSFSTGADGNGGNITINAPTGFIVTAPNENSDISANAFSGSGGKVNINTKQNFWIFPLSRTELQQRLGTTDPDRLDPRNLPTNEITAISQVNPNLSGQVNITPPEVDPSRGLSPLPNTAVDLVSQINPNCSPKALANNSFTSVGKGGLPDDPRKPLQQEPLVSSWVKLNPQDKQPSMPVASLPITPQPFDSAQGKPLVEASGWRRERNGDVVLFASNSAVTLPQPQPQSGCVAR